MRVWLDDMREPPSGWEWAQTYEEAIELFEDYEVEEASLDHDLGADYHGPYMSGYNFILWLREYDKWPTKSLAVHSMNPVGAENMCKMIEAFGPYQYIEKIIYQGVTEQAISVGLPAVRYS